MHLTEEESVKNLGLRYRENLLNFGVSIYQINFGLIPLLDRVQIHLFELTSKKRNDMMKVLGWVLMPTILLGLLINGCDEKKETVKDQVSYNMYSPERLHSEILEKKDLLIIDIQVEEAFAKHHIKGAIKTMAFPVKSDADKAKLDPFLEKLFQSSSNIVVVCPRGRGGAKRTVDYFVKNKIPSKRIFILEKGQDGWPYKELLES